MRDVGVPLATKDAGDRKVAAGGSTRPRSPSEHAGIPDYLKEVYHWAYLNPRSAVFLDREPVVSAILWGQHRRLQRAVFEEIKPGCRVLLPAHVYGRFVANLARHVGPAGRLDVTDISPLQLVLCTAKTKDMPWVSVARADARNSTGGGYDAVCCYFLLHELPDADKCAVVDALLDSVRPGGSVVFVDYHRPNRTNPLKPVIGLVFDLLEPFARSIWNHRVADFAREREAYSWRETIYFGGLYQRVVATRR